MKKISKPTIKISNVISDAVFNMQNENIKNEILSNLTVFQGFEDVFNYKKQRNELYGIAKREEISENINIPLLKKLYSERMLVKGNGARKYYDALVSSAPDGICTNCNHRVADTLDHYLPKSEYPILSVSLVNLIPSCAQCNKYKLVSCPLSSEQETIHPYYDDIECVKWLECEIIQVKKLMINFKVKTSILPDNNLLKQRIINHFDFFLLNKLYKTHAAQEFSNIRLQLVRRFNKGGTRGLRNYLFEGYESRLDNDINSWQTAFYECMYLNDDFCAGMFI